MKKSAAFAAILCLMCVFVFAEAPGASALPRFLRNFDWYLGLGLGACAGAYFGAGPLAASGTSYFINPNLAIHADISVPYFFGLGVGYTGMLGVKWKL